MAKRIVILGGGPGGHAAAIRSADLGAEVTLVEKRDLGGTCLNRGCIPTKVFSEAAHALRALRGARALGIDVGEETFSFSRLVDRKERAVSDLRRSMARLLESRGVDVLQGRGKLESQAKVTVLGKDGPVELGCDNIVIATGSRPVRRTEWGEVDTTDTIFGLRSMPRSLAVIGGGTTGVELSAVFSELGCRVTLIEARDRLLPEADADISRACRESLEKAGVEVLCPAGVEEIEALPGDGDHQVSVSAAGSRRDVRAERVVAAAGRSPNTESLWRKDLGLATDEAGWIKVDHEMRTNIQGVFAVGDVVGGYLCAHTATAQGILAAEIIMGTPATIRRGPFPRYVSSVQEIAWVGLTEARASEQGIDPAVGRCPAWANSRLFIERQTEGFAKVVADGVTGEILGVHVMADHAVDMVTEVALMMSMEACLEDLASAAHPHPTHSEMVMEAARNALGWSVGL